MFDYEKEYANLVGTIDFALTLLFRREKSHRVLSLC